MQLQNIYLLWQLENDNGKSRTFFFLVLRVGKEREDSQHKQATICMHTCLLSSRNKFLLCSKPTINMSLTIHVQVKKPWCFNEIKISLKSPGAFNKIKDLVRFSEDCLD